MPNENTIQIFIAYSREDAAILQKLRTNLKVLERTQKVKVWYDGEIEVGADWEKTIKSHLHSADIILLLISENFIASDYSYDVEMTEALSLHDQEKVRAIPVIAKECLWQDTPFARLQALPEDGKPLTSKDWSNQNRPYLQVVQELKKVMADIRKKRKVVKKAEGNPILKNKRLLVGLPIVLVLLLSVWGISKIWNGNSNIENDLIEASILPKGKEEKLKPKIDYGKLADSRDGQIYKTIKLKDGKTWMAENLNFKTKESYCYDAKKSNCDMYGRLYTWKAANEACPDGWHLPTDKEWRTLVDSYGGVYNWETSKEEGDPKAAYKALTTNEFEAFLGGCYRSYDDESSNYEMGGGDGFYWNATERDADYAWSYYFHKSNGEVGRGSTSKSFAFSCRCIKD